MNLPHGIKLVLDPKRERMTASQAALVVRCLAGTGPRDLRVLHSTGVQGEVGDEWVECSSAWTGGVYRLIFKIVGGILQECLICTSPKGLEFNILSEGGSPFDGVPIPDRISLSRLLIKPKEGPSKEEVKEAKKAEEEIARARASTPYAKRRKK